MNYAHHAPIAHVRATYPAYCEANCTKFVGKACAAPLTHWLLGRPAELCAVPSAHVAAWRGNS